MKYEQVIKLLEREYQQESLYQAKLVSSGDLSKDREIKNSLSVAYMEELEQVMSLLNSENTEGVSTSSRTESGVSHGVSDRNASRAEALKNQRKVVGGTLALRTEAKEFKYCDCVEPDRNRGSNLCLRCGYPIEC